MALRIHNHANPLVGQGWEELMSRLAWWASAGAHPLLLRRDEKRIEVMVVTADKGLAGAYSSNLLAAADAFIGEKAKTAEVRLLEIRLAMALGGKAFVTMTGSISAVQSAVDAGAQVLGAKGMLVNKVVIAAPPPELLSEIV